MHVNRVKLISRKDFEYCLYSCYFAFFHVEFQLLFCWKSKFFYDVNAHIVSELPCRYEILGGIQIILL